MGNATDTATVTDPSCTEGPAPYTRPSNPPVAPDTLTHGAFKIRLSSGVAMRVLTDQRHGYVRARIWRDGPCGCGNTEAEAVDDLRRMYPGAAREDVAAP